MKVHVPPAATHASHRFARRRPRRPSGLLRRRRKEPSGVNRVLVAAADALQRRGDDSRRKAADPEPLAPAVVAALRTIWSNGVASVAHRNGHRDGEEPGTSPRPRRPRAIVDRAVDRLAARGR
jgi:hypothetical protein